MRKKKLLQMPVLKPTQKMINKALRDGGYRGKTGKINYKYSRYYRAAVQDGILKVAVWSRCDILKKRKEPTIEIYISKSEETWINYNPRDGSWGKARIENIYMEIQGDDYYGVLGYDDSNSRDIVSHYFHPEENSKKNIRNEVLGYQKKIANGRLQRRYRRELEMIDSVMERVPDVPKDFEKWVEKDAYAESQYMIYDRAAGKARCTSCWGVVEYIEKFRHNKQGKCPLCREKVTYKSWNKQSVIIDRKNVGIMQRMKDEDGYVLRIWKAIIRYVKENDYTKEMCIYEDGRLEISDSFSVRDVYVWDKYKHNGPHRWVHDYNKGFYQFRTANEECIIYHKNMDRVLKGTDLGYLPAKKLFQKRRGLYTEPVSFLKGAAKKPQIEVLIKVGLYQAGYDLSKRTSVKEWNRESPWKYLGITKDYFNLAIRYNLHLREIDVMAAATEYNTILNIEQIEFYTKYFYGRIEDLFKLGHQDKMYKYLKSLEKENKIMLGDYLDYLEDLRVLHITRSKSVLFPKNFVQEHINVAQHRREKERKIEMEELAEKNRMFKKLLPWIRELYECEDDLMKIVIPTCKEDFQKEGQNNHNCVGGSYFDKMLKEKCVVVFLRKKEDIEKSFCTVEFDEMGRVLQNRTKYNHDAPQEAKDFINRVAKTAQKKIKEKELEDINRLEKLQTAAG